MKLSDNEIIELHDLFDGLVENNLSIKEKERLQYLLENSEEARHFYIRFIEMSASLKYYADELLAGDEEHQVSKFPIAGKVVGFASPILAAAAIFAVGFYIFFSFDSETPLADYTALSDNEIVFEPEKVITTDDTVAVLTKSVGVEWSKDTGFRPQLGTTLELSRLQITKGLVQLEFLQGSTVILEGPVDFQILNSNEGKLSTGKLRATVPQVARGFTVNLPKGRLIDLGTEFGLNVHLGGSTEIFVYKGNVLYRGQNDSDEEVTREISGGEALFVDPLGYANWVEMPSEPFLGTADLAYRSKEESQVRHAAWLELSKELSQNANTSLYYSFDNQSSWTRVLQNQAGPQKSHLNGAIIGCKWSEGRWPGKGALSFERQNDRVRLNFHEKLPTVTLCSWIKIDKLQDNISPILCSNNATSGSASWYVNGKGQVVLEVFRGSIKDTYQSAVAFRKERLGKWMHVVTTYDLGSKRVSHFVNGRPFSHEQIKGSTPISFANSQLGHFGKNSSLSKDIVLHGSVDEFVVLNTASPESDIRRMYEIGCPYEMANSLGPKLP
ncbi:MAG: hypothetical protein P8N49_07685 [Opitutales bacterium]|nr:hypothetical protein [Opitutales bacterium]